MPVGIIVFLFWFVWAICLSATLLFLGYPLGRAIYSSIAKIVGKSFCAINLHDMQVTNETQWARITGWAGHIIRVERIRCTRFPCDALTENVL